MSGTKVVSVRVSQTQLYKLAQLFVTSSESRMVQCAIEHTTQCKDIRNQSENELE